MEQERKVFRIGLAVILFAAVWKLLCGGLPESVASALEDPKTASFLMYLETGRVVRPQSATEPAPQPTEPAPTQAPVVERVAFEAAEAADLEMYNAAGKQVRLEELVTRALRWDLTADGPAVLILHTHATESYLKTGQDYVESAAYRTLDGNFNMLRIGDALKTVLESYGIEVIHDRTLHDHPSYTGSYNNSRRTAESWLEEYPGIRIILDVHRDSVELSSGVQMDTSAQVAGQEGAQLMMVVGTNAGGLYHPHWEQNLTLATQLHVLLERQDPGIMRPIYLRTERFNQDLRQNALLVEVGAAGNTLQESILAAEALGHAIGALRYGAN